MANGDFSVEPADEHRHQETGELLWNESYYLDFVAEEGRIAGYARIGLCPNMGVTWWTTMIVGEERPLIASVDYKLAPPPGEGVDLVTADGPVSLHAIEPLATMNLRCRAPARVLGDPREVYRGEAGQPATLGLDLTWVTDGLPYHYGLTTRYEIPCLVSGEIEVDGDTVVVAGQGQRDHSWGVRDWWAFGWCWVAARLDDGTRLHFAGIRMPGGPVAFGYLQAPGRPDQKVEAVVMHEDLGDEQLPIRVTARVDPGALEIEIRPIAFAPLLLVAPDGRTSRFPRAAARFATRDGRKGTGWIEWNQPDASSRGS